MAPDSLKKTKKAKVKRSSEEIDPDTFLFEDDDDEDDIEEERKENLDDDDFDSFGLDDDWD
ncbi:MAG: hypothetical protein ACXADL_07840 [Candidatus Thorarchaeota archaeon]|jgi:hypothetical protein